MSRAAENELWEGESSRHLLNPATYVWDMQMFYHSVVASVIFYAVVCWGSRVKAADAN